MSKKVLITGGAGFIGSHLVDKLIEEEKQDIVVFDNLEEQIHGKDKKPPLYLNKKAKFIYGSVTDNSTLKSLVKECDVIFHLAANVGVGQSMYQIEKYVYNNISGTANLLDILVNSEHRVKKLVVASSNTIYGEGKYKCKKCGIQFPRLRGKDQLEKRTWDLNCEICGNKLDPLYTDETAPFNSSSIYALTKQNQEQMALLIGKTYNIDTTVLRFFLVYGPRQSLSNPYTGVCSMFSSRLLNGQPPIVFEDGLQTRDFVHVSDVCQALSLAMNKSEAKYEIFNVGSGSSITIKEVAEIISKYINPNLKPIYNQQYRIGDIRNCAADITKIKNKLGYNPKFIFKEDIKSLLEWIKKNSNFARDDSQKALSELKDKGLLK